METVRKTSETRRVASRVLRKEGYHPCPITSILWKMGPEKEPGVIRITRQIQLWIDMWRALSSKPQEKRRITLNWYNLRRKRGLVNGKIDVPYDWKQVKGPMMATFAILQELGWHPDHPNIWYNGSRQLTFTIGHNAAIDKVVLAYAGRHASSPQKLSCYCLCWGGKTT